MEIKTCEEYVLNELKNAQNEVQFFKNENQNLSNNLKKVKEDNKKLIEFINKLVSKTEFREEAFSESAMIYVSSWDDDGKETIKEIKKYKEENKENKNE